MTSLVDLWDINRGITEITKLKTLCDETLAIFQQFKNYIEQANYNFDSTQIFEDQIKNHENLLDAFDEVVVKRTEVTNKANDLKKQMDEVTNKVNPIVEFTGNKEEVDKLNNELVEEICYLQQDKAIKEQSDMKRYKRIEYKLSDILEDKEKTQLEQWTQKKCGEMIFHSDRDRWCQHSSDFDDKIFGRSNLVFVVEDTEGNEFGYYTPKKIETTDTYYNDTSAFLFTLKSNGRINGMMEFESLKTELGFIVYPKTDSLLFGMTSGFWIEKENRKTTSYCYENGSGKFFNFHDQKNPLIGKSLGSTFTPKRFVVIQMN